MNKSLSATTALIALVLSSMPAYAGPILDDLVGPSFTSWTASDENIKSDGSEIYTNLSLEGVDETITFDEITLQRGDDLLTVDFKGMNSVTSDLESALQVSKGFLSGDLRLFTAGISMLDNLIEDKVETCDEFDVPFRFKAHDLLLHEPEVPPSEATSGETSESNSGDNSSATSSVTSGAAKSVESNFTLGLDMIAIDYGVNTDNGDCIMDMDMTATGLSLDDESGFSISVAWLDSSVWWSLLNEQAPQNLSKPYTARFDINDTDVIINGMPELHIDLISTNNTLDPASMSALVNSGYDSAYRDIIGSSESEDALDFSDISLPIFWNATADLVSNGDFTISGLEITGDLASIHTGTRIFERGRKLDLSLNYEQNAADVSTNLSVKSDDLFDVDLNAGIVMDDMDMALEDFGPEALMIAAPVSLRSLSVKLKDDKFGAILGNEYKVDPYMMVEPTLMTWLGHEAAGMISEWLGQARTGGTSFVAAPDQPVPVMQIFEGVTGDWSALGQLLNVKTGK